MLWPDGGGTSERVYTAVRRLRAFLVEMCAGVRNVSFDEEDINYLRKQNKFSEEFLNYLENFRFTGDIWAIPEGTVVFPNEPLITVKAPIIQAQLLETMLLLTTNHQSLIATKTSRIVKEAQGRPVMEFGARRAHGINAAVEGARAAIIGGAVGTSCTLSAKEFNVPASGTMAHSWIQSFDSEYEAFKAYAELYPDDCTFLIDTYNTIESGLPNAIKVFNEVLKPKGYRPKAVRLDSGDLAYLSKKVRKILDEAGYEDCKICATNSLDEYLIKSLIEQDAKIDLFGVGENLITAKSEPVFGGVYKLVALEKPHTPNKSILASCSINDFIKYSSSEFVAHILQSSYPASSNIFLTFLDKYAKSPLSSLTAFGLYPLGFRTSLNTLIAFGRPDSIVLYVSIKNVQSSGYSSAYALKASYSESKL